MTVVRSLRCHLAVVPLVAALVVVPGHSVRAAAGQRPSDAGPSPRASMGMAYNPLGHVVMFGGDYYDATGNTVFLDETWTWDGATWTQQHPSDAPLPRCCVAMGYDGARNQVVLFGGNDPYTTYGDTWTWDGSTWTQQHPVHNPPGESGNVMVYDAPDHQMVMFGLAGQTWVWNGTDWRQKHPHTSPVGRERAGMAYDALTDQVVLFGGDIPDACFESPCWFADTWTWDGSNWHKAAVVPHPKARTELGMAYDSQQQRVVLFGGSNLCCFLADTWTWDGVGWTPAAPSQSPLGREALAMAYDGTANVILLFGGRDGFDLAHMFGDTWAWEHTTWAPL